MSSLRVCFHLLAVILLVSGFLALTAHSAVLTKRETTGGGGGATECPGRQPCGWMVYNKNSRQPEYFMNNTCVCMGERHCLQTDDDLSVGAYVYRCIEPKDAKPPPFPLTEPL